MKLTCFMFATRKFRFVDPKSKKGRNLVLSQIVKFVIAWHIIGYFGYQSMLKMARMKDPDFDKKSSAEKQLSMLGNRNLSETKRYKLTGSFKEGFRFVENSDAKESDTCVDEISEDAAKMQKL